MLSKRSKEITLWRTALPYLAQILVGTMSAPINSVISSLIDKNSFEAVSTASSIMFITAVLTSLLSGGAGIIVGQYLGRKSEEAKLKAATDTTLYVVLAQAIVLMATMFALSSVLLKSGGIKEGTKQYEYAITYLRCMIPAMLLNVCFGYFISTTAIYGRPIGSMVLGISNMIIDMTVSFLLVKYTDLGVYGLIIGTITARFVAFFGSMVVYSIYVQPFWKINHFNGGVAKKIMHVSVPIAGEKINYNTSQFILGVIVGNIAFSVGLANQDHNYLIGSRGVFNSMQALVLIGAAAMNVALERVVSRQLGEGKFDEAKHTVFKALMIALSIDITLSTTVFFIQDFLIDFLTIKEPNPSNIVILKDQLHGSFLVLIALEVGRVFNMIYVGASRSAGDSKFAAIASVPITGIFAIFLSGLLARYAGLGGLGITIGMALDEIVRGAVNYGRGKSGKGMGKIEHLHNVDVKKRPKKTPKSENI